MVASLMLDCVAGRRRRKHSPGLTPIGRSPKRLVAGVDDAIVSRVKGEDFDTAAQVDHSPGATVVIGDVSTGHIAMLSDHGRVAWTDGRRNHRSPAPRADDLPLVESRRLRKSRQGQKKGKENEATWPRFFVIHCAPEAFHPWTFSSLDLFIPDQGLGAARPQEGDGPVFLVCHCARPK